MPEGLRVAGFPRIASLPRVGKAWIQKYRFPPSNLRPFGAPPSVGRREYPREPLPLEGAAERSEAGLASFFAVKPPTLFLPGCVPGIAAFSYRSLPPWGRGTASAVDRVLSFIVCLRRSFPLFFIPLEPYPARSARHLPHAGKALIQKYRFPHPTSALSGHLLPQEGGSIHASPFPWKGLPSAARRGWLPFLRRSRLLFSFQAVFRV